MKITQLMRFSGGLRRNPAVDAWFRQQPEELGALARHWFEIMRECGDDVRELLHDDQATACVGDAAFAYVAVYRSHVNVGFFRGAELADPHGLLEGTGKLMRHVKLRPGRDRATAALTYLIATAHTDMQERVQAESA